MSTTTASEIPFNQIALATVLKETAKARAKVAKPMDAAKLVMTGLRSHGWRVVPFPPLKSRAKARIKTNGTNGANGTNGHKRKPGRPRKQAA